MDYLEKDYSFGNADKADAQKKKVRRHLDTLHECFENGCIVKREGKTRKGHDWYYDADKLKELVFKLQNIVTNENQLEFVLTAISALDNEDALNELKNGGKLCQKIK